jgi:hypothetical protein
VAARQVTLSAPAKEWGSRDLSVEGVSDLESDGVGASCVEKVLGSSGRLLVRASGVKEARQEMLVTGLFGPRKADKATRGLFKAPIRGAIPHRVGRMVMVTAGACGAKPRHHSKSVIPLAVSRRPRGRGCHKTRTSVRVEGSQRKRRSEKREPTNREFVVRLGSCDNKLVADIGKRCLLVLGSDGHFGVRRERRRVAISRHPNQAVTGGGAERTRQGCPGHLVSIRLRMQIRVTTSNL